MPTRIQRKRTKGFKLPPNTVYVGRPSKWGNPYLVGRSYFNDETYETWDNITPATATRFFREAIEQSLPAISFSLSDIRAELRGKNLACYCPINSPCHADILLELANQDE